MSEWRVKQVYTLCFDGGSRSLVRRMSTEQSPKLNEKHFGFSEKLLMKGKKMAKI